ncbi:MAG TPA: transglycosylase domain-containing protein [Jatrophihabitans sp.]
MASASGTTIAKKLAQLIGLLVVLGVLAAGLLLPYVGGVGLAAKSGADKFLNTPCTLTEEPVQQKTTLLASDGKTVIATLFDQNRSVVSLNKVPKAVTDALISTEDRRFYQHHGVDMRGLIRGALKTSNGDTQGASTLTEQYVKQVRYYNANTDAERAAAIAQNVDRKISDAKCALQLEKKYSKAQILEKYLNIAFFGENSYGIQTAAQTFFGEDVSKLTVPQAALLVGLVKSPTTLDPYNYLADARARRDLVIGNMASQGDITPAQATAYQATPVKLARLTLPPRGCAFANPQILNAGFFCDYATQWLHDTGGLSDQKVNTGGLRIVTTLDVALQNNGQNAIWTQSGLDPKNPYLLAMPSVNPSDGAITSMITDKKYGNRKGDPSYTEGPIFTKPYAGSGSTYKYFTALAALKSGATPDLVLNAPSPYHVKVCTSPDAAAYSPSNAGSYDPNLPLRKALPESSNTYFVAMEDQYFGCNIAPIVNTATGLGMTALNATESNGKTIAQNRIAGNSLTFTLGQESTSVLQLTGAFSALANGGTFCPPTPIKSVTDPSGNPVSFKKPGCSRQFDPWVANTMLNIMTNDTNPSGTGGTASQYFGNWYGSGGSLIAGKTGTNNAADPVTGKDNGLNSALWFVGVTPKFVSAAALVNPDRPNLAIQNVPGITAGNNGADTFGAYAAKFWLQAFGPSLMPQKWTWPTVDSTPGTPVQNVDGRTVQDATQALQTQGFKVKVLTSQTCASPYPQGTISGYSPGIALPGATITLCVSSGYRPYVYVPPVKKPTTKPPSSGPAPRPTRTHGGGGGG